jgi:hypothetical protein
VRPRGTGSTTSRITRDRRPARSVTRTEIVPALVPGGTRATHPAGERLSLVASAPFDQRKLTRIPPLSPVPRSWTCLPIMTCGRGWQTARVAGTHHSPVSFGGGVRAWAAVGASASRAAIAKVCPCCILGDNRSDTAKSRRRPRLDQRRRLDPRLRPADSPVCFMSIELSVLMAWSTRFACSWPTRRQIPSRRRSLPCPRVGWSGGSRSGCRIGSGRGMGGEMGFARTSSSRRRGGSLGMRSLQRLGSRLTRIRGCLSGRFGLCSRWWMSV